MIFTGESAIFSSSAGFRGQAADGEAVQVFHRGALLRGSRGHPREIDPDALSIDSVELRQGLPERHLAGDSDQQALQLELTAQRGVATQAPVQLQAAELLSRPGAGRLDDAARDAELLDDLLEGGPIVFDFLADPFERLAKRGVAAVAPAQPPRQLDTAGRSAEVVIQIDGEIGPDET